MEAEICINQDLNIVTNIVTMYFNYCHALKYCHTLFTLR